MKHHNVHGEGKRKGAFLTKKKAAALALCVSLWIAGGSVASAEDQIYINADGGNTITNYFGTDVPGTVTPSIGISGTTKLTVKGGDWSEAGDNWWIRGGYSTSQDVSGYEVVLDGVKNVKSVWGAMSQKNSFDGNATHNSVTLINSTVVNSVYGGQNNNIAPAIGDRVTDNGCIFLVRTPSARYKISNLSISTTRHGGHPY